LQKLSQSIQYADYLKSQETL